MSPLTLSLSNRGAFEFFLAVGFLLAGQDFAVFFDFVQVVGPLVKGTGF